MYIKKTTFTFLLAVILLLAVVSVWPVLAGSINSPSVPESTNSYTLQDIYARLTSGTAGSQSTFTEPVSGPGSTMADLNTIMAAAPAVDVDNGAAAADVASGKTFWGLTSGEWGLRTGTGTIATYAAAVPKTGQTTSYATRDDGDLERGVVWPNPRFTDNSDGTVTDNLTGLIWLRNANCFGNRPWATALADANGLASGSCDLTDSSVAGDWRLSNVRELQSLIDYRQFSPALPSGHPFSAVQSSNYYWSSTSFAHNTTNSAWSVNLRYGFVLFESKGSDYYVWPVRAGQ